MKLFLREPLEKERLPDLIKGLSSVYSVEGTGICSFFAKTAINNGNDIVQNRFSSVPLHKLADALV